MKILFNTEPMAVCEMFLPGAQLFSDFVQNRFLKKLEKYINSKEIEYKTLISERTYFQLDADALESLNPILITDNECRDCLGNQFISHCEALSLFQNGTFTKRQLGKLDSLYKEKLNGWIPDIIISIEIKNKLFDVIYPNALQIANGGGLFKANGGFPYSYTMDPLGEVGFGSLNAFISQITEFQITFAQNEIVENFKNTLSNLITINNPDKSLIQGYKEKFDYLLLLPLQFSNYGWFDEQCPFKTQWDLVSYVMDRVPANIGVIVTEHNHYKFLNEGVYVKGGFLSWFQNKYKNFIYYEHTSLPLLPEVDGIVNVSSSLALTGLLFDIKIISLAKNHNDLFKDVQGLENIEEVLQQPLVDKNNIIYWYLTHYVMMDEKFKDGTWLYNYFKKSLAKFRNEGINFAYFEENEDIEKLSNYVIEHVNNYFLVPPKFSPKLTFLQKVFSVKNQDNHKVIRIFGLKIKIRKKQRK